MGDLGLGIVCELLDRRSGRTGYDDEDKLTSFPCSKNSAPDL